MTARKDSFKLILIGDAKVGKTSFVRRHTGGQHERDYVPTRGVKVTPLTFDTTSGPLTFNVWDTAGERHLGPLYEGVFLEADCGILMFDVTEHSTYRNISTWYGDLIRVRPMIPIVLVGNKVDVRERKVTGSQVTFHKARGIPYVEMSAKSRLRLDAPFEALAQRLLGDPEITFQPAPSPDSDSFDGSFSSDAPELARPVFNFTFNFKAKSEDVEKPVEELKEYRIGSGGQSRHGGLSFSPSLLTSGVREVGSAPIPSPGTKP
jgi:GTP-binding nuclear protein Ran